VQDGFTLYYYSGGDFQVPHTITRRYALGFVAISVASITFPKPLTALTEQESLLLIQQLVTKINTLAASQKTDALDVNEVHALFQEFSDIPMIARKSLGVEWRSASDDQKSRYIGAFSGYLSRRYAKIFNDFQIAKISGFSAIKVKSGYLVKSRLLMKTGNSYFVEWQVASIRGQNKMVNVIIEGISMLATERAEIIEMLDARRGSLDKLIADMSILG
jgi:phospholipid transport system substrate-binding protein